MKTNTARRVTRRVQDFEFKLACAQFIPLLQISVYFRGWGFNNSQQFRLHGQGFIQKHVTTMKVNRCAGGIFQGLKSADVINMRVSCNNIFRREIIFLQACKHHVNLIAGVNNNRLAGLFRT